MERDHGSSDGRACYYSVLGLRKDATASDIRAAYRKQAMKWHPDKWTTRSQSDANRRFQEIQEAYSVLSDQGKKSLYDAGLYDPLDEEDEGFSEFVDEMLDMMGQVKNEGESFEDLQKMFKDIFSGDDMMFMDGEGGGDGVGFEFVVGGGDEHGVRKRTRGNSHHSMRSGIKRSNARV